jgi:hypothetical protein
MYLLHLIRRWDSWEDNEDELLVRVHEQKMVLQTYSWSSCKGQCADNLAVVDLAFAYSLEDPLHTHHRY